MSDSDSDTGEQPRLVVASGNPGKIAELVELLGAHYRVERRPDGLAETVEDGDTLEANAIKKAAEVVAHTGAAALADDTGLFVAALGDRPGVHTARYAGVDGDRANIDQANMAKLLDELDGAADRSAQFRTVIALCAPGAADRVATGVVTGTIATVPSGADGFGYDPVFIPDEGDGRTFAQMSRAEKGAISHRGRALRAMLAELAG
jgi:XTP/dITP diphosphohydrolase